MNDILKAMEGIGNPILQIAFSDLKELVKQLYEEERKRVEEAISAHRERPTMTRKETAKMLGVSLQTLWEWGKSGYLVPVKIGTKVMYRPTDVEELLAKQKGSICKEVEEQTQTKESRDADETLGIETLSTTSEPIREPLPEIEPDDLPF